MVTKITAVVSDGDAKIEMEGNKADVINLAIQIVGSTIASVPEQVQPRIIKRVQDSIPRAVQEDARAIHSKLEREEQQMPNMTALRKKRDFGRTKGFAVLTELAKTDPNFVKFLREVLDSIDGE